MCYEVKAFTQRGSERKVEATAIMAMAWRDEFAERMIGKPTVERHGVHITEAQLNAFAQAGDQCDESDK